MCFLKGLQVYVYMGPWCSFLQNFSAAHPLFINETLLVLWMLQFIFLHLRDHCLDFASFQVQGPKAYTHCHHLPRFNHIFLQHRKHILQAQFDDEQSLRELMDNSLWFCLISLLEPQKCTSTNTHTHTQQRMSKADIAFSQKWQILTKHTSNVFNCCRGLLQAQPKR